MAKGTEASIDLAERWLDRIKKREQDCATWYEDAARVYKRYRNEGETVKQGQTPKGRRFNVLWSNINVMRPALYAQAPKPEVERKHQDKDEVGRLAAQVLERAVLTSIQDDTFTDAMKMARDDRLMAARGQVWLQYVPTFGAPTAERLPVKSVNGAYQAEGDSKFKAKDAVVEDDMGEFTPGEEYTPVVSERVKIEFVHHKDFLHSDAPSWDLVTWVARRVWMTKRKIAKRFGGACAAHIDTKRQDARLKDDKTPRDTAPIWEIWDKDSGTVIWVCPDYKEGALDQQPDPMGLEGFFPCPRPVYGTLTPDSLIPVPDYTEYADQARELDLLTDRAYKLIEGIRVAGVYDSNAPGLAQLFNGTAGDKFVAVNNWAVFAEKGGLKSAMDQIDVSSIAESLQVILNVREQVKRDLYEVSGIADIMRGDTSPSETLGAQKLKASFGSSRMREPQAEMQRFVRDVVRIIAEIICEHFSPEQIADMAGAEALMKDQFAADPQMAMQTYMAAVQLLKEDRARGYRITIETDSTVELDAAQEKADRIEFLTAATGFLEKAAGMAQIAPSMTELMGEMLMWGMKAFRISRDLEKSFEKALGGIAQEQQQRAMQPPQPDPAIEKARMDAEAKSAEMQASQQLEQARMQAQQASDQAKLQADGAFKQQEFDFKARELALKEQELQFKMQQHMDAQAFQREEFDRDGDMKSKEMAMSGRSKPSKDGGEGDDMGQSMPAITIQMPDDVAQILVQQRTEVSQRQIAAAQAEEAAALAEADAQRSLPQLLLEAAQAQRDTAQAFVVAAKVMAAPKKLVKTASGEKIAMPLLDGLVN